MLKYRFMAFLVLLFDSVVFNGIDGLSLRWMSIVQYGILKAYWQRGIRAFVRSTITIHAKFFRHREALIDLAVTHAQFVCVCVIDTDTKY